MPGAHETFGLVAFEAAASGARVVACATAPSARRLGALAHTFDPGDFVGLLAAIERARRAEPDRAAAAELAARHAGLPRSRPSSAISRRCSGASAAHEPLRNRALCR